MTAMDRIADLSLLWKQVSVLFPYFDRRPLDWDGAYREYLPKVLAAESEKEFHLLLAEFMNLLGDGHTDYILPTALRDKTGYLPFSLLYADGGYCIRAIAPGGEAFLSARVEAVNGKPMGELLPDVFRYLYHVGGYAYPDKLEGILPFFLKPAGNVLETSKGAYRFDLVKERPAALQAPGAEKPDIRRCDGNILCIRLDNFLRPAAAEIAQALEQTPAGVILDLRENIGGMTKYGADIAELFISGVFHGCQKRTRLLVGMEAASASQFARMSEERIAQLVADGLCDWEEAEQARKINANTYCKEYTDTFGAPDHRAVYSGPCVLLTSRNTISAAEDFAAMFRSSRRAELIGTPTHGSTGTPMLLSLSCGGRARICSVGYRLLDGTEFIGRGIAPDILLETRMEDLERCRDRVLEYALGRF